MPAIDHPLRADHPGGGGGREERLRVGLVLPDLLLAAHQYLVDNYPNMTKPQKKALKSETFKGWELVQSTARLCAMNMLLHGIGDQEYEPIVVGDSLAADPGDRFDLILANPPFGKKSGTTIVGEGGKVSKERDTIERDDFWATTSNKQLNFVQHIATLLKINGGAAVVVPDNVLFEGGAGETVRRRLLQGFDVHTLLRLPTGMTAAASAKSSIGRLDLMTRVITDQGIEFDRVPEGYDGPLYMGICPRSSSLVAQPGQMLEQHRE